MTPYLQLASGRSAVLDPGLHFVYYFCLQPNVTDRKNKSMLRFSQTAIVCLGFFLLTGTCFAQSFRIDSKDPQQINTGDFFSSIDGRFAIALPKQISGYTPNVTDTPNGRVETINFGWRTAAGVFLIGY